MTDVEKAINANNKLEILGKQKLYHIIGNKVYLDTQRVSVVNLKVPEFVYGIFSTRYSFGFVNDEEEYSKNKDLIETIEFGSNIKEIKNSSFYAMKKLKSISDLDKVDNLDCEDLFYKCVSLLRTPRLPDNVKSMQSTFDGCESLIHIENLPKKCTQFNYTFRKCTNLIEVPELPECAENIDEMFMMCTNLKKAPIITRNVISMIETFKYCYNLEGILRVDSDNSNLHEMCDESLYQAAFYSKLILTGKCSFLEKILASSNTRTNIEIER